MDTKQIITNFLNDQKSFKDFFSSIGEYVDERLTSCKAVHDANVSLAEQNKDLFLECQKLEDKIKELEDKAKEKPVVESKKTEKSKPKIVRFDEIKPNASYTTTKFGSLFLISARTIYDYLTFRVDEEYFKKYCEKKEQLSLHLGYYYNIKGQLAIDALKKVNPNMEVFYRVAHLDLDANQKKNVVFNGLNTNEIFLLEFSNVRYIKHSLVLRLGLKFRTKTISYSRFQKYKDKAPVEVETEEKQTASDFMDEPYVDDHKDDETEEAEPTYTIAEFANKYLLNKKSLKLYLKDLLKMKLNECFPAGFTVPASFVRDFTRTVNPDNEPFYPGRAFESDENLKSVAKYIQRTNRVFVCPYFEICYIMHSEVKRFNLKFKDQAEKKIWENNEKKR